MSHPRHVMSRTLLSLSILCALLAVPPIASGADAFRKVTLVEDTLDPIALEIAPDGRVIFIERAGKLRIWKPDTDKTVLAGTLPVYHESNGSKKGGWEDGLIGLVLDPGFATNQWVYLYHSPLDVGENHLSRFTLKGDALDADSAELLLRVKVDRDVCCHAAGGMVFDRNGNLYLSTGDNTNPFQSDGYAPIDFRSGREGFDAARSSANTADLRGKILRIHPEPDGAVSIPKGNLFPPGGSLGRPEIYTMGHRNPWRISVDAPTGFLYWGEVGPDAQLFKTERGPAGFDEINRTDTAGNFGWPFVIANNKPYRAYNFEGGKSGELFDVKGPENLSPHNNGAKTLPPAQPAWIYYPYSPSALFREVGSGARCACAGPVFHADPVRTSERGLPKSLDNHLFLFDWSRNWIKTVDLGAQGNRPVVKAFAENLEFKRPTDLKIGPDGCLYLIEFGTAWEHNEDSLIVRIESASL